MEFLSLFVMILFFTLFIGVCLAPGIGTLIGITIYLSDNLTSSENTSKMLWSWFVLLLSFALIIAAYIYYGILIEDVIDISLTHLLQFFNLPIIQP